MPLLNITRKEAVQLGATIVQSADQQRLIYPASRDRLCAAQHTVMHALSNIWHHFVPMDVRELFDNDPALYVIACGYVDHPVPPEGFTAWYGPTCSTRPCGDVSNGPRDVEADTRVEVRYRSFKQHKGPSGNFDWRHEGVPSRFQIVAFRVLTGEELAPL